MTTETSCGFVQWPPITQCAASFLGAVPHMGGDRRKRARHSDTSDDGDLHNDMCQKCGTGGTSRVPAAAGLWVAPRLAVAVCVARCERYLCVASWW